MADIIQLQNGKEKRTGARRGGENGGGGYKSGSRQRQLARILERENIDLGDLVDCRGSEMLSHDDDTVHEDAPDTMPENGVIEVCSDEGMVVTLNFVNGRINSAHCG